MVAERNPTAHIVSCALLACALAACPAPAPPDDDEDAGVVEDAGPEPDAGPGPDAGPVDDDVRTVLDDAEDVAALRGASGSVKFLLQVEGVEPVAPILDACVFQNTTTWPFHLEFIQDQPGGEDITYQQYVDYMLHRATRVWWGGAVVFQEGRTHPLTDEQGVLLFFVYSDEGVLADRLTADDVREVYATLAACTPFYEGRLAFYPEQPQRQRAAAYRAELEAEGIAVIIE